MYDEEGKIKKTYIAGSEMHYLTYRTYDKAGNIVRYRVEKSGGGIVLDYQYEYDKNGNRTKEIDNMQGKRKEYVYDELNQLTKEEHFDTTTNPDTLTKKVSYDYDILGNRTLSSEEGGLTYNFEYEKTTNEITKVNGLEEFSHDANGNLTNNYDWEYIYNDANQLIEAKENGVTKVRYEYNSDGLRSKKELVDEGKVERYYYNGNRLAYITDGSETLKYFFLRDMTERVINMVDYTATT
ncbi:MAG: hypothetical protein FH753_06545 [Firmicutes bacterium]|nr:hypothetical protein [Bacillota bacterium]